MFIYLMFIYCCRRLYAILFKLIHQK